MIKAFLQYMKMSLKCYNAGLLYVRHVCTNLHYNRKNLRGKLYVLRNNSKNSKNILRTVRCFLIGYGIVFNLLQHWVIYCTYFPRYDLPNLRLKREKLTGDNFTFQETTQNLPKIFEKVIKALRQGMKLSLICYNAGLLSVRDFF